METNGNSHEGSPGVTPGLTPTPQGSLESLSEYTDAHEDTASAPTEFLAEFLSAIMIKDYEVALKYCKLILQYEPNNATAKELYPLIIEKIHLSAAGDESSEDSSGEPSDGTTASYSSLEDEEVEEYNGNCSSGVTHGSSSQSLGLVNSPSDEFGNGNSASESRAFSPSSFGIPTSPSDEFGNGNCAGISRDYSSSLFGIPTSPSEEFSHSNYSDNAHGFTPLSTTTTYGITESTSLEFGNGNNCDLIHEYSILENIEDNKHNVDKENGNSHNTRNFIFPSSSEESSPTEPVSQTLAQPLTQLRL